VKSIRIGCGAGYSGDRIEPAVELAEKGQLNYLVFECLAERTIALAQQMRAKNRDAGFDRLLQDRMRAVLVACRRNGVRIITNMGAANPLAATAAVREVARELGLKNLKVAAVLGDDVLAEVQAGHFDMAEPGPTADVVLPHLVSANAYIGAAPIVEALAVGADVVITGRAADPALFLAPQVHEFGWRMDDWNRLGAGTVVGHLLECAGQVTGGYFSDPGVKDVPDLARLGFPIAEVADDGTAVVTKVDGSGGEVSLRTCKEQLLYEIHDPASYVTPDVVADFSAVRLRQEGRDRVRVEGGRGRERPASLKVSLGYRDGFIGEGQISYAGERAVARARQAVEIVRQRLALIDARAEEVRYDVIGVDAIHGTASAQAGEPYEVRVRVAARTSSLAAAKRICAEVEALYTNGPAGGAGAATSTREVLAMQSTLIPRERVQCHVQMTET
jgi:hypothetical protein